MNPPLGKSCLASLNSSLNLKNIWLRLNLVAAALVDTLNFRFQLYTLKFELEKYLSSTESGGSMAPGYFKL